MESFKQFFERKYYGTEAAGTIFVADDTKRILFLKRSGEEDSEQGQWEITIGGKKDDEDIDVTVTRDRESNEEIGDVPNVIDVQMIEMFVDTGEDNKPFRYTVFSKKVKNEFKPKLSHEHDAFKWVHIIKEEIPTPLHFGTERLIYKNYRIKDLTK